MIKDAAYWIALAHLPGWGYAKINSLTVQFFHEQKISIENFFQLSDADWKSIYQLDDKQVTTLTQAKTQLASNAFLAESMFAQGFEIIPITSPEYSRTLKLNLKASHAPTVLYTKGNKKLLSEASVAIVGSRTASERSLSFTDNVAKLVARQGKLVVSGFAKGVDKQALDSALKYKGQSIIVLPQGIMTFSSGFKQYYQQILGGDVLVVSTFFPKAPWKVELAMARNPIIYGLANEIYVAESAEKGGTWSGVVDGFRKGRKMYVREPDAKEQNANGLLIQMGATAVDFLGHEKTAVNNDGASTVSPAIAETAEGKHAPILNGSDPASEEKVIVKKKTKATKTTKAKKQTPPPAEPGEEKIRAVFNGKPLSAAELLKKLELDWTAGKLTAYLKKLDFLETVKEKNKNYYKLKGVPVIKQSAMFV